MSCLTLIQLVVRNSQTVLFDLSRALLRNFQWTTNLAWWVYVASMLVTSFQSTGLISSKFHQIKCCSDFFVSLRDPSTMKVTFLTTK